MIRGSPCLLMPPFLQPSSMVLAEKYHGRKPWVSFRVRMTKVDVFLILEIISILLIMA